jgi:hypothetical protein
MNLVVKSGARGALVAIAILALSPMCALSAPPAVKSKGVGVGVGGCPPGLEKQGKCVKAPELDASAGTQALALLAGGLLLVGERTRRRKAQ